MDKANALRVAANVRAELGRKNMLQVQLAKPLGVSTAAVNRRMTGAVDFSITELYVVAEAIGVSINDLLGEVPAAA